MNVREGDYAAGVVVKVVHDIQSLILCLGAVEERQGRAAPG